MNKLYALGIGLLATLGSCNPYKSHMPEGLEIQVTPEIAYTTSRVETEKGDALLLREILDTDTTYYLDIHNNGSLDTIYRNGLEQGEVPLDIDETRFGNAQTIVQNYLMRKDMNSILEDF